jgi:hypothetical protein
MASETVQYRYGVYLDTAQQAALAQVFGCVRVDFNDHLRLNGVGVFGPRPKYQNANTTSAKLITQAKLTVKREWLADAPFGGYDVLWMAKLPVLDAMQTPGKHFPFAMSRIENRRPDGQLSPSDEREHIRLDVVRSRATVLASLASPSCCPARTSQDAAQSGSAPCCVVLSCVPLRTPTGPLLTLS